MPVVCCGLHSQVPLVAAAVKQVDPELPGRLLHDRPGLAGPAALRCRREQARTRDSLDSTITCGQAFGGELEAVNLHSGLLAARHVAGADVAVVAIGPGVVGTATPFGHGGVAQGEAVNAVAALGGIPIAGAAALVRRPPRTSPRREPPLAERADTRRARACDRGDSRSPRSAGRAGRVSVGEGGRVAGPHEGEGDSGRVCAGHAWR